MISRAAVRACLGLALLSIVVFGQAATFEFVWDDGDLIVRNPVVRGEAPLKIAFTRDFWWIGGSDDFRHGFWRPLTLLYYRTLSGLTGAPWAFHVASIGLHAVVTVLFFLVIVRHLPVEIGLFAGSLFAVHPLRVESVAWVSSAGDLLCAALLLASLLLLETAGERGAAGYLASLFAFGLALLSKEAAFMFPLFLTAKAWIVREARSRRASLVRLLPFWALAAVLFIVRRQILGSTGLASDSPLQDALTAPVLLAGYLVRMLLPFEHTIHSGMAAVTGLGDWRVWSSMGFLALGSWLLLAVRARRGRDPSLPLIWTVLFLAPVCAGRFSAAIYSERYTYIPALGFSVLCATGLGAVWKAAALRFRRWPGSPAPWAAVLVLVLAGISIGRVPAWRDDERLYTAMLAQDPADSLALFNLGMRAVGRGKLDVAEEYFLKTLQAAPGHSAAHNSLGNIAWSRGDIPSAEQHYRRALSGPVTNFQALFNLAVLLDSSGRCDEARGHYRTFIARAPPELRDAVEKAREADKRLEAKRARGQCSQDAAPAR